MFSRVWVTFWLVICIKRERGRREIRHLLRRKNS